VYYLLNNTQILNNNNNKKNIFYKGTIIKHILDVSELIDYMKSLDDDELLDFVTLTDWSKIEYLADDLHEVILHALGFGGDHIIGAIIQASIETKLEDFYDDDEFINPLDYIDADSIDSIDYQSDDSYNSYNIYNDDYSELKFD